MTENIITGFYIMTAVVIALLLGFLAGRIVEVQRSVFEYRVIHSQATKKYCSERTPFIKEQGDEIKNYNRQNDQDRTRTQGTQGVKKELH
jgi:CRISPR/Cas system-associated endoribonuclease Cas2